MKLLSEIIDLLSSSEPSIQNALFKAQVLAHQLGETEMAAWVGSELRGYTEDGNLPAYRILRVTVMGNLSNGVYRYVDQPIPMMNIDPRLREKLEMRRVTQSIVVVEEWARKDQDLAIVIAPENFHYLRKGIDKSFDIERAWAKHSVGALAQVVIEVRSRLLELALQVQARIPQEPEQGTIKDVSREAAVSQVFRNTVYGNNNTIVLGGGTIQNVTNSIVVNDVESLIRALEEQGIGESDVTELRTSLVADADSDDVKARKGFGPAVRRWMGKMLAKAAEGGWEIAVSTAGGVLAAALAAYYGFGG